MKVRNLALTAALFVGLTNMAGVAMAQTKVFVINEQRIRAETKLGKEMDTKLNAVAEAGVDQLGLKNLKSEIDTEAAALKPQTQSLSKEAIAANPTLKARVEGLNKKANELIQKQNALNQGLEKSDNGLNAAFMQVLGPAVEAVAKEAGADIVVSFSSTWYMKGATDLSAKVIARLDATVPTLVALQAALPQPPAAPKAAAAPGGGR
ncbi:MAG: OmpH family outer membrane protein [Hyphomonadaceae bacterium]